MKIIIKNKFFSLRGSSNVEDESGRALFQVKGKFFTFTAEKELYDMNGKLLYTIRNKFFNWWYPSAYICDANGNKLARIKRNLSIKHDYSIEGINSDIRLDGTFWGYTSKVYRDNKFIGTLKKEFWAMRDYFTLEVEDGEDAAFLVALVIALDNIQDKAERS